MKKIVSLIRACMTNDMSLFKFKRKANNKSSALLPTFIALYLMFMIWGGANSMFEKLAPMNLAYLLLSVFAFSISIMTFFEGIYKSGPLIFNCKDDQLLLSLPISKRTVLFVRVLKFYIFELLYNSLFLLPVMIAYIRWDNNLTWTYYLTSFVMLLMLPIIPIVLSCIVGVITSSISSKFKYKNLAQIVTSMVLILAIFAFSYNMDGALNYVVEHSTGINDFITKIYYPAGVYAKLITNFNGINLFIFILINILLFATTIFILSKFYFKINSRLKNVATSNKKINVGDLKYQKKSPILSIIKKEFTTFFNTPVFIINAGFALVLFLIGVIALSLKFNQIMTMIGREDNILGLTYDQMMNHLPIIILLLVSATSYLTSITNSVISLEGKNINILKSLPITTNTILMGKILASLFITTPVLWVGDIILFIVMKIKIIDAILLLVISVLIPLVSHFIGIIVNLKYPKLDWESTSEVVKQSTSSFLSVMIGMVLLIITAYSITKVMGNVSSTSLLFLTVLIYIGINLILYGYMSKKSTKEFDQLSI